ncbi:MAG TPA: acetate--CoA ligase family protein [Rhizomicrobium sp.]
MPWRKTHRAIYSRADLKRLIEPDTIAIVGLSSNEASFGARTVRNLAERAGGRLYGVNPRGGELHGVTCYPAIAGLPERIDCAILALPRESVEAAVEQCAAAGTGACIIYASGFSETGHADRVRQQQRLADIGRGAGMRIVGPNCIGIANNLRHAGMLFVASYASLPWRPGPIGLVSQSGGLGHALTQVAERGGSFSHFFSAGNSCDVDVCDYISYLAEDPGCRVITCIAEGLKDGERLLEAGEKALAADKPIVMHKIATGAAGAKAAMSHTGTLAGSNAAYEAAYRRAGIVAVENMEDVYETASFLAKAGHPRGEGVAAMAASGGGCVITLDKAEKRQVPMPPPAPATRAILEANIPEFGSPNNPCDITAQVAANPQSYRLCAEAMLRDPAYAALVVMTPSITPNTPRQVPMFSELAKASGKPVCISWLSEWLQGPGSSEYESDPHAALFHTTDRCFQALAGWLWRERRLRQGNYRRRDGAAHAAAKTARAILAKAGAKLSEREGKALLETYGVPVARDIVVRSEADAVAAAKDLGFPVVLKVESPDIPHKTEAGVVRLGISDADAVRSAYRAVTAAASRLDPKPDIRGVLVQPMIPPGLEIVVGTQCDPTFGPMVVVGLGGVLVEVLRDSIAELAPVDKPLALDMLTRLRGYRLLEGYRGAAAADIDALAEVVVRLSELAVDLAGEIAEIDVNPLICTDNRIIAVDALVVRHAAD